MEASQVRIYAKLVSILCGNEWCTDAGMMYDACDKYADVLQNSLENCQGYFLNIRKFVKKNICFQIPRGSNSEPLAC